MSYSPSIGRWMETDPAEYIDGPNEYEFVHDNPANRTDPTGLYDWSGHYYTTYILALMAGMGDDDAAELAYWSEYPDLNQSIDAVGALARHRLDIAERIQNLFHSLTKDPAKRRCILSNLLSQPGLKPWQKGILTHALGDAYAHSFNLFGNEIGFVPPFGHLLGGHAPDYIGNAPDKWRSYIQNLFGLLGGNVNDPRLAALQAAAPNRAALTFLDDFWLGDAEINALRDWARNHLGANIPDKDHIRTFGDLSKSDIDSLMKMIEDAAKSGCCK